MSANNNGNRFSRFDPDDDAVPTIVGPGGTRVTPVYTEKLSATTQNDSRVHQTLCGQTYVEGIGETEWRVTLEGLVIKDQLIDLFDMRPADNEITVIGEARVHENVTFDRFTYEQNDELGRGKFEYDISAAGDGSAVQEVESPLFSFQLQTEGDT